MSSGNTRKAIVDLADAIREVFKKYTQNARKKAWNAITTDKGDDEIERLIVNPGRPTSRFKYLNFSEWLQLYPSLPWVQQHIASKVLEAYVVHTKNIENLEIAIVIPPESKLSAAQFTEKYHAQFWTDDQKPKWNNKVINFHFFYPGDGELESSNKMRLM